MCNHIDHKQLGEYLLLWPLHWRCPLWFFVAECWRVGRTATSIFGTDEPVSCPMRRSLCQLVPVIWIAFSCQTMSRSICFPRLLPCMCYFGISGVNLWNTVVCLVGFGPCEFLWILPWPDDNSGGVCWQWRRIHPRLGFSWGKTSCCICDMWRGIVKLFWSILFYLLVL